MARNSNEKLLSAEIDSELVRKFCEQSESRGFKKKRALQGAVELWISLPDALQAHILAGRCGVNVLSGMLKYITSDNQIDLLRAKVDDLLSKTPARAPSSGDNAKPADSSGENAAPTISFGGHADRPAASS